MKSFDNRHLSPLDKTSETFGAFDFLNSSFIMVLRKTLKANKTRKFGL